VTNVAVGKTLAGTVIAVVSDASGNVYWKNDLPWNPWTPLGKPFSVCTVDVLRAGYDVTGELIFQAICTLPDETQMVASISPLRTDLPWDYVSPFIYGRIYDCIPGATKAGTGTFASCADELKNNTNITFYLNHQIATSALYSKSGLQRFITILRTVLLRAERCMVFANVFPNAILTIASTVQNNNAA
jgi:hypothetical protein